MIEPMSKSESDYSSQTHFKEHFVSHKLDMVFVLDTSEDAKVFYKEDRLGSDFLSYFEKYDWKLAWTDMSVDRPAVKKQEEDFESGCDFISDLFMTATGVFANSPGVASFGFEGLVNCFVNLFDGFSEDNNEYANGTFLPFENSKQALYKLTKETPNNSAILHESLLLPNNKKNKYKAPILKETPSFPLLSMTFSLANNLYKSSSEFFREDSLIVFVLVSFSDTEFPIRSQVFKESVIEALGSDDRFKIVLITLTEESNIFCTFTHNKEPPKNIVQMMKEMNQPILDICSQNLGQKLFNEIFKNLASPF